MNSSFCEKNHPGGINYGTATAHGICKNCGVGGCKTHSERIQKPLVILLCRECFENMKDSNEKIDQLLN